MPEHLAALQASAAPGLAIGQRRLDRYAEPAIVIRINGAAIGHHAVGQLHRRSELTSTGGQARPLTPSTADLVADLDLEPYGRLPHWPGPLRAVTRTLLDVSVPMALACGPSFVLVYNDAYAGQLGSKHPDALGRPAAEVLAENWTLPGHGDRVEEVFRTGRPFTDIDTALPLRRRGVDGPVDEVHFARSYSAVRDEDGSIVAVLAVISETTGAARTLAGIGRLAGRLASAATVDDVAREALWHAIGVIGADQARVVVGESDGRLRMTRATRTDLGDEADARLPPLWSVLGPDVVLPSTTAARTRRPVWLGDAAQDRFPQLERERLGGARLRTVAALPFDAPEVSGSIALGWEMATPFDPAQRSALSAVAGLVGHAMSRAVRFDQQLHVSAALQRAMLPAGLPQPPGVTVFARYLPSAPGTSAGGDFYDAFALPGGRLAVTIGDVVGHGVEAAATMGQVRAALRVALYATAEPGRALDGLDPLIAGFEQDELFVTALVAVLDPVTGHARIASAGHPPPLLVPGSAGGPAAGFVDLRPGPPLGVPGRRPDRTVCVPPGASLVAFTDGLIELPGRSIGEGLAGLRAAASRAAGADPRRMCAVLTAEAEPRRDDVAVLLVTRDDRPRRTAGFDMAADATGPVRARRWAAATLRDWDLSAEVVETALVCVSELSTNALLHARGAARVELESNGVRLLIEVSDTGPGGPLTAQLAAGTDVRGRGLALVEALSSDWGAETHSHGTTVWCELPLR